MDESPAGLGSHRSGAYLDAQAVVLGHIAASVIDLPSTGLSALLDAFWDGWSESADNPGAYAARRRLLKRAQAVTGSLNGTAAALTGLANDLHAQLDGSQAHAGARAQSETLIATIQHYQARLDQIARCLTTSVNALHADGYDLDGTPGRHFFSGITAASIRVVPGRPNHIVVSATCYPGASIARQLAVMGKTPDNPGAAYRALVASIGADLHRVLAAERRAQRASGATVNGDTEVRRLLACGRDYRAGAQTLHAVTETLDILTSAVHAPGAAAAGPARSAVGKTPADNLAYAAAQQTMASVRQISLDDFVQ